MVPAGSCRAALADTSKDLRVFRRFVAVYRRIDSAYRVGSVRRYRSALRELGRVQAAFKDLRSPTRQLRAVRASCR